MVVFLDNRCQDVEREDSSTPPLFRHNCPGRRSDRVHTAMRAQQTNEPARASNDVALSNALAMTTRRLLRLPRTRFADRDESANDWRVAQMHGKRDNTSPPRVVARPLLANAAVQIFLEYIFKESSAIEQKLLVWKTLFFITR